MLKNQKAFQSYTAAILLVAIMNLTFMSSSGGFRFFSPQTVSAQTPARQDKISDDKKDKIPTPPAEIAEAAQAAEPPDAPDLAAPEAVTEEKTSPSVVSGTQAVLTGTKNIPGDYATLAAAITDLNANGVGTGGVTFNVLAGNAQTAPAGGYVIGGTGSLVLTTSSAANPIIFTGNGNTATASATQTVGNVSDAVFKLVGADFVTIQGFTIQENAANAVIATTGTNNATEFGVALFYVTATDGAKNNTVQNNTITLNRAYATTIGIFSTSRTTSTSVTATAEATSAAGTNTDNHYYGNNISNTNYAIALIGAAATAIQETGNDIGGAAVGTGNTITNYSTGTAQLSSIISLTGTNAAIYTTHQISDNISFNSMTSAALTSAIYTTGIFKTYSDDSSDRNIYKHD